MNLYFSRKVTHFLICFIMFDWCFVGPVQPMSLRSLAMVSQGTWAHTVGFVMWFISTVLLTDSCHDHAVIRDLSHYNPLVTPCVTLQDNTICARVSLNSCLLNRRHDSREVAMGKSKSREKPRYRSALKMRWGLAPSDWPPGGGVLLGILGGLCHPVLLIHMLFQTKKCHFPDPFSDQTSKIHTRFQTWPFGRNYVIIIQIRAQTKRILQTHFEFAYFSFFLPHLKLKRWIRSYTPVVPSKTIPNFRPKGAKCIHVFRPKRHKNPTRWGGTYLFRLYKGVPPPPFPGTGPMLVTRSSLFLPTFTNR